MRGTAAISIAALVSALMVTPALALDLNLANSDGHDDLNATTKVRLDSKGIDASSVIAIDVGVDGSVDVYEG